MSEISYFDYMCSELGARKKYLQYVPMLSLYAFLLRCTPNNTYKKIADNINKRGFYFRGIKTSRIPKLISEASVKTYTAGRWAETFGVEDQIKEKTFDELVQLVEDFYKEKDDD